jgi:hypothetical protein
LAFVLTAAAAVGLLAGIVVPAGPVPLGSLLAIILAAAVGVGIVSTFLAQRLRSASVELELDASRRWVTVFEVHPAFAAAVLTRTT